MNTNRNKIKQIANILRLLFSAASYIMAIAFGGVLISIIVSVLSNKVFDFNTDLVSIVSTQSDSLIFFAIHNSAVVNDKLFILLQSVAVLILIGIYLGMARIISSMFLQISRSDTPFMQEICSKLKKISLLMLMTNLVFPICWGALSCIFFKNGHIWINMSGTLFFIIFYGLALIFEYGTILQQEADEIL